MILFFSLLFAGIGLLILIMLWVIRWPSRRKQTINLENWPTFDNTESLQQPSDETSTPLPDVPSEETVVNWIDTDIITEVIEQDDILSLYVFAPQDHAFVGQALLEALLAEALDYNEIKIFEFKPSGETEPWFKVISATEPGTFDAPNIGALRCSGLCFYLQLTEDVCTDMSRFKHLVAVAKNIANALQGQLCDQYQQPFTEATYLQLQRIIESQADDRELADTWDL